MARSAKYVVGGYALGGIAALGAARAHPVERLADLEAWATANNPTLRRMQQEAAGEWAKTGYVAKLPDPSIGTTVYTPPVPCARCRTFAKRPWKPAAGASAPA